MVFYNYFQARLSRVLVELRLMGDEFVELLKERPAAPTAPNPTAPEATARGDASTA
jgi:biopolymer transport protein ExbB